MSPVIYFSVTHTLTIVFLCKGISDSTLTEEKKKREKSLQLRIVGERSNFKKIPTHTQDHGDA